MRFSAPRRASERISARHRVLAHAGWHAASQQKTPWCNSAAHAPTRTRLDDKCRILCLSVYLRTLNQNVYTIRLRHWASVCLPSYLEPKCLYVPIASLRLSVPSSDESVLAPYKGVPLPDVIVLAPYRSVPRPDEIVLAPYKGVPPPS